MKTLTRTAAVAGALALAATPAMSHHSHAMFDHTKFDTITGTVIDFAYVNPHGALDIAVMSKDGKMDKYWFEMSNLSNMVSRGIKKTTFKPGDKVNITYHPLKDGRKGGSYTSIVAADGHHYE